MIAGEVMDRVAALLNDSARSIYTYSAQTPYINMAADELKEAMEESNVPCTNSVSAAITIPIGTFDIGGTGPALPTGLVEIQELHERDFGSSNAYIQMDRKEFLPKVQNLINELRYWTWQEQIIKFVGANTKREVKIDYVKSVIDTIADENTVISVINSKSFLAYRTAALCSEFIGENKTRADDLNTMALLAIERSLNISTKGRQVLTTKRRPFNMRFRMRGY